MLHILKNIKWPLLVFALLVVVPMFADNINRIEIEQ